MCGFVIIVALEQQGISEETLKRCSESIAHRGPDDEQIIIRSNIGIAFRRLSINDLNSGVQPLWSANKSTALVCNGEIYNSPTLRNNLECHGYHFQTGSDCEAILPLYQSDSIDFVNKLEGMFAFALVDFDKSSIAFGRDRFGIKPLYYYKDKSWLIIGSEIKALLASNLIAREPNTRFIYDSFSFGHSIDQQTIVKNIYSLAPAHSAHFDFNAKSELKIREYWRPTFPERKGFRDLLSSTQSQKEVRENLTQAVNSHLLSDVPVAAYLSGGLDSTITSLLMKRSLATKLTTFSIGFADAEFDESKIFRQTIELAGFNGIIVQADAPDINLFPETIRAIEMLQFSPMDIPLAKLSARVRAENIKVVMCGEGADELFGGYAVFPWMQIAAALSLPSARSLREPLTPKALRFIGIPDAAHSIFSDVFSDESIAIEKELGFFPPWLPYWRRRAQRCASLFSEPEKIFIKGHPALLELGEKLRKNYPNIDRFDAALFTEIKTRLPNYILHRADRTSMKNSVEARVPFLDRAFAESALNCPPIQKTFGFKEKKVLRKAFSDILPPHLKTLRKFGYSAPNQWCWAPQAEDLVSKYLSNEALGKSGLFNVKEIESRISGVKQAVANKNWSLETMEDASFLTGVMSMQVLYEEFFSSSS